MHQTRKSDLMESFECVVPKPEYVPDVDVQNLIVKRDFLSIFGRNIFEQFLPLQMYSKFEPLDDLFIQM